LELSTYLHFANNANIAARGQPEYDWLAKVHPVITAPSEVISCGIQPSQRECNWWSYN